MVFPSFFSAAKIAHNTVTFIIVTAAHCSYQSYCSSGLLSSSSLCPKYLAVITVIVHTCLPVIQSPSFVFVRRPYALYTTPSPGLCYAQLNLMLLSSQQVRSRQMWPSPRKNHTGCCHCDRKFCLHFTSAGAAQGFVLQQKGFMSWWRNKMKTALFCNFPSSSSETGLCSHVCWTSPDQWITADAILCWCGSPLCRHVSKVGGVVAARPAAVRQNVTPLTGVDISASGIRLDLWSWFPCYML